MSVSIIRFILVAVFFLSGSGGNVIAGDILRGGASSGRKAADARVSAGAQTADLANAKAVDRLARTTKAINDMRTMQASARAAAGSGGIPNGLTAGGLKILTGANANWTGASAPVRSGDTITITQNAQQAVLHWETFNVGKDTTVHFDQTAGGSDTSKWIAFNKIFDPSGNPTQILGQIKAEGQIYILNQNGIIFGAGSQVNTRTLVASSIPINDNLIERGLLNQEAKNVQFLFSTISQGTFTPPAPLTSDGKNGDVLVERGAVISSPASNDGNGGRIMLVGANVNNSGSLSTPSGQIILAAGLQIGIDAHSSSDPSRRGIDVYVGSVGTYAGTVVNQGLVESSRGSILISGKNIFQQGVVSSSTSVSLNGRVDLNANYDAVANAGYDPSVSSPGNPFLFMSTGSLRLGQGSITTILPEVGSQEKTIGTSLPLRSQVNFQGLTIYLEPGATVLAPNAQASLQAGGWGYVASPISPTSTFLNSVGQVYLDSGSLLDVSGTTGSSAPMSQNLLTIQLRGAELSNSPEQRKGAVRGLSLTVDLRQTGTYGGTNWIGTPLGDVSGYAGLIERTVGQLSAAGGTVDISAGGSVVVQRDSIIDVSGGWVRFESGTVQTSRLLEKGRLVDIANATPDRVYAGIYQGISTISHSKWGVSSMFNTPLAPLGSYNQKGYIQGAAAGSLSITSPTMALDGQMQGTTVVGPRQLRDSGTSSALPGLSTLSLSFHGQQNTAPQFLTTYPFPPDIVFATVAPASRAPAFQLDGAGNPTDLPLNRKETVNLSPDLLSEKGFGSLIINNEDGSVSVPSGTKLAALPGGSLSITAGNIRIGGDVSAPGGSLAFKALNISPYAVSLIAATPTPTTPPPNPGRGIFSLEGGALLSTAGTVTDDRPTSMSANAAPISTNGGSISVSAYSVDLGNGGIVDVSGGVALSASGKIMYGNGGSIAIRSGQDPDTTGVVGGSLVLGANLRGFSTLRGGNLSVQAEVVQIGGGPGGGNTLALQSDFFQSGGFSNYVISGLGRATGTGDFIPGLTVEPGTVLEPLTVSWRMNPFTGSNRGIAWAPVVKPSGVRTPASVSLVAAGVKDTFTGGMTVRGDLVLGDGAVIRTDPGASVSLKGNTVAVLGSIYAPSGSISIAGGSDSASLFGNDTEALTTVYVGLHSMISAAGAVVHTPDPYGRKIGTVLPGGSISITGNIFAEQGAVLDVSGAVGILDVDPAALNVNFTTQATARSGVTTQPRKLQTVASRIDSNAGSISLQGSQMLYSEATLLGRAGGPTSLGGTLEISSGRYYPTGTTGTPLDSNLVVTQNTLPAIAPLPATAGAIGQPLHTTAGGPVIGRGYFKVSAFEGGAFDTLALKGVVEFSGVIDLTARNSLRVADGGVIYADSEVRLTAPYVALGTVFQSPVRVEDRSGPFSSGGTGFTFPPTYGPGSLIITAGLIDVGFLSLQNIGQATLAANNGDIRGNGALDIAGHLTLQAGQIYPVTASDFTVVAYDYVSGGSTKPGTIDIVRSGTRRLPLSAGGSLGIYASVVNQGGVLVAPMGSISLGWDGTGTAPNDLIAGGSTAFPVTSNLMLSAGSITSVSAVDPVTGKGLLIPYGISPDGNSWIDPRGVDITAGGLPSKSITLSGTNITTQSGSVIDLRGGGDLYAYRWVQGQGGTIDLLASNGSYAVIPGYESDFAPYSTFNSSAASTNLISGVGYANSGLKAGDRVYLGASASLPAGYYTLLPARYALLPGAALVTPTGGTGAGVIETAEGASLVPGFRFNSLNPSGTLSQPVTQFEVLTSSVMRSRAQYEDYFANGFLSKRAGELNIGVQRLPADSGNAVIQATQSMSLRGTLNAQSISQGRGAKLDISSTLDFVITSDGAGGGAGTINLDANVLNGFGVETILIGGTRTIGSAGTNVTVRTGNITLNNPGTPLSGAEIILAASNGISLAPGSSVFSSGSLTGPGETLLLNGNGALVRVSGDRLATVARSGVTTATGPLLAIGAGSSIEGPGITLDSSSGTSLNPTATIIGESYYLNSGQISLRLSSPGALLPTTGLTLTGPALLNFQSSASLSLLSYSSIDIYGTGQVGSSSLSRLTLSAGEIRGFNQAAENVLFAARDILIDNAAAASDPGAVAAASGTLAFNADTVRLGVNQVNADQFLNLSFTASQSLSGEGAGGLSTQGGLNVTSPLITAGAGASRTLTAAGAVNLLVPVGAAGPLTPGGLGASYTITGLSVSARSNILLPSGSLSLKATGGALAVSGLLDVSGTKQIFYDVTKFTDAGEIRLSSDTGNVLVSTTGKINISGQSGGGNAGSLSVSTPNGSFTQSGVILGQAGVGGRAGSFDLDVFSFPSLAALSSSLTAAGLVESQTLRVRSGDVAIDGTAKAHSFSLSADLGSIAVSGTIDASGATGGTVSLSANGNVILLGGSSVTVAALDFNDAGKGGSVSLEAGSQRNGVTGTGSVDIRTGSRIDLTVASKIAGNAATPGSSASEGKFSGTLHIRAPQNSTFTSILVAPINGTIADASSILVEGYRLYDLTDFGGIITPAVQQKIKSDGEAFLGASGTNSPTYAAMSSAILAGSPSLSPLVVFSPGAEVVNRATVSNLNYSLNSTGSTIVVTPDPGGGGGVVFVYGTPGNNQIRTNAPAIVTSSGGAVTNLAANTPVSLAAGSTVSFLGQGTITFVSGSGGAMPLFLSPGATYTQSATGAAGTVTAEGSLVAMNTAGSSSVTLAAGSRISLPYGTVGTNRIRSTVAGTITSPTGVITALAANTNTQVAAGSLIALGASGTISFASGGPGGPVQVALASGSFTTAGATALTPATGDLVLGTTTSTATSDWDLSGFRFGANSAPGVLTLRSAGNLVLFNALSDGFQSSAYNAPLLAPNPLLPINAQSWSYRLVAGADMSAAEFGRVSGTSTLNSLAGFLQLGKNDGFNISNSNGSSNSAGSSALTSLALANRYQVIRTGSGNIDVSAGRSVQLLNEFATIYTAGTQVSDPTLGGVFDIPNLSQTGGSVTLGANQQSSSYPAQYSMAGGNISIIAGMNIEHLTLNAAGQFVADSQRQLPDNWLDRRGYINTNTGLPGTGVFGETASTTWWVDFSNFFQSIGALGGGNILLRAGQDVSNVDEVAPTNARMAAGIPSPDKLLEIGGGDIKVVAGRNIDAGVYYVERGKGVLSAGGQITTNSTRSISLTHLNQILNSQTWLPTTLFLGKGGFDIQAKGNLLLGPVANTFLLPEGINNTFWYKTYFSTYSPASEVSAFSLGGTVTLRESVTLPSTSAGKATPILYAWLQRQLLLGGSTSASYYQPWLRLNENSVAPFATVSTLMPPGLRVTSFSSDINVVGDLTLFPSPTGTLELLAAGNLNGLDKNGLVSISGTGMVSWGASRINLSDADPSLVPSALKPFAYQSVVGTVLSQARQTLPSFLLSIDSLFNESGATQGSDVVLQKKAARHSSTLLHVGDSSPLRIYARGGDISGITLFSPKAARIFASRDITDVAFYIQNLQEGDSSIIASGRDIIPYDANSLLRSFANSAGNIPNISNGPLAGDVQISGLGTIEVLAGGNLDLGTGSGNNNGTGDGITSVGNTRNPFLPFAGANIIVGAGMGSSGGLSASSLDFPGFISSNVAGGSGYLAQLAASLHGSSFASLSNEDKDKVALEVFFLLLRDAGRTHSLTGNYDSGFAAIKSLFGTTSGQGNILTRSRDIRTKSGGDISIFAPSGGLTMANTAIGSTLTPPGIVTEDGGNISIFTDGSVDIGIGRIFTLRGGNQIIWSSTGNIAAGSSSKTVQSAPPTRVLLDPQSADVQTDLAGLATGGGIGVLATVKGVAPGDVDLIAPIGTVDAGDAGIRVTGNLNIAATQVLNAGNIAVGGTTSGVPTAPTVVAPNIGGLTSAASSTGAANAAAQSMASKPQRQPEPEIPSRISVEVLGYGGGEGDEG